MKIQNVLINNKKKSIEIETRKGIFSLPFSVLEPKPTSSNRIKHIYIDPELGKEAVTYILDSSEESSIHLDAFLEYNRDPDYLRMLFLYELTMAAKKNIQKSSISKNEICRRMNTSPSQLARLLDQSNHQKSVDKMLMLLAVLGVNVKLNFNQAA